MALEALDPLRERGLGHRQAGGRTTEVAVLRDGDEEPEVAHEVHEGTVAPARYLSDIECRLP